MKLLQQLVLLIGCGLSVSLAAAAEDHGHGHEEDMAPTGAHGGRLMESGNFAVELQIYEQGVEPEFRAWAYDNGEELAPDDWTLSVSLERLGGRVERFNFASASDGHFLRGDGVVGEPHSFDVSVNASYNGQPHSFSYESHEGRIEMSDAMAGRMGIGLAEATPQELKQRIRLYGNILPDPNQIAHVHGRYPGIIQRIDLNLGDRVEEGQLLAVIQANDSLQNYEVRAPITGTVVDIHANPGELAAADSLLTIANYERVWAALYLFPGHNQRVRQGQSVSIQAGEHHAQTQISYLNPGEGRTPYVQARAPIDNRDASWTPGLLVEGQVTVDEFPVDLAVDNRALQEFRDWQVVFIRVGDQFEIRPLELGRTDGRFIEVLDGLSPGDVYVVENSFLLKADLEKSGASHSH